MKPVRTLLSFIILFALLAEPNAQTSSDAQLFSQFPLVTNTPPSGTFWLYSMYGMCGANLNN